MLQIKHFGRVLKYLTKYLKNIMYYLIILRIIL